MCVNSPTLVQKCGEHKRRAHNHEETERASKNEEETAEIRQRILVRELLELEHVQKLKYGHQYIEQRVCIKLKPHRRFWTAKSFCKIYKFRLYT